MTDACNAGKCSNPMVIVNNIRITGYEDPALEGEDIKFIPVYQDRYLMELTHRHVRGMENGNQTLWRYTVLVYQH